MKTKIKKIEKKINTINAISSVSLLSVRTSVCFSCTVNISRIYPHPRCNLSHSHSQRHITTPIKGLDHFLRGTLNDHSRALSLQCKLRPSVNLVLNHCWSCFTRMVRVYVTRNRTLHIRVYLPAIERINVNIWSNLNDSKWCHVKSNGDYITCLLRATAAL